jgi:uncharacterized protein DUF2510
MTTAPPGFVPPIGKPPGWLTDEHGQTRYWNGDAWTEHVTAAPMSTNAPAPPLRGPHQAKRPWWQATWVLLVAGLVIGLVIGVASAGGGSTKTRTVAGPTVHVTATPPAPSVTVTATPTVVKVVATHTKTKTVIFHPTYNKYGEGTYVVGKEIQPGDYHTTGGSDCYWATLHSLDTSDIIDNSNSTGPQTIEVPSSAKALEVGGSCTFGRA